MAIIADIIGKFESSKKEKFMQVGGQNHKSVAFKVITQNFALVDDVENQVGVINTSSLAITAKLQFNGVEGYFSGALGVGGSVYVWSSCGSIVKLNALNMQF